MTEEQQEPATIMDNWLKKNEAHNVELNAQTEDMINRFSYHQPKDLKTSEKHEKIRNECLKLSSYITYLVPKGREQVLAITHLEEVMLWANAGIARAKE